MNANKTILRDAGETDWAYSVRVFQSLPKELLKATYVQAVRNKTGMPPFGKWYLSASKRVIAIKLVEMTGAFDATGKAI